MTKNTLPLSIQIGMEAIRDAGGVEAAIREHRETGLAADILLAHLYQIDRAEGLRLAAVYG